jgi:L-lactate dehydrogenase complex protein LldG
VTDSRADVLSRIKAALGRRGADPAPAEALRRLREPAPNLVPARARLDRDAQVKLFISEAERVGATAERVGDIFHVPERVRAYLARHNLSAAVRIPPDPLVENIPWSKQPLLSVERKAADGADYAALTGAFAGVAETGTLILVSGAECPPDLHFLASTHIVVLPRERVVGAYEEAWALLRSAGAAGRFMPRAVNWITGPSRTADIEQTLLMGAHGPKRLHVIVVERLSPIYS